MIKLSTVISILSISIISPVLFASGSIASQLPLSSLQGEIDRTKSVNIDRAIASEPPDELEAAYLLYIQGVSEYKLGRKGSALLNFDRAARLSPDYAADSYVYQGVIKAQLGQKEAAITDFTKAAELYRQQNKLDLYQQTIDFIKSLNL